MNLYPWLFASVPILYFAARNPGQFDFRALAVMLMLVLAGCTLVYILAALLTWGRKPEFAAFVALLAVLWFFGYARLAKLLAPGAPEPPHQMLIPAGVVVSLALLWWVARRQRLLEGLGRFLSLTAALVVGWSGFQIGAGWVQGRNDVVTSPLARKLAQPIEGEATVSQPRRDIYVIVLDEYANSDVLRERFGYDNHPFEDSLRALGFHVPRLVRSNYTHTVLSLPSMLNAAHLVGLEHELGPRSRHPAVPNYLVDHNRVAGYLESKGYRYVFFPSQWWYSTVRSSVADAEFHPWGRIDPVRPWEGFDLVREMSGGELQRTIAGASVLRYLDPDHRWEADHVRRSLKGLASLSRSREPVFAFAHVLKPHDPYVFDRKCATLSRHRELDHVGPYLAQLECVNRLLLDTVHEILDGSEVPPIIILQGDHGTKLLGAPGYDRAGEIPPAAARERLGAFGAYYLPGGGAAAFGDTVTVVNVLGNVLRYYFGASLPRAGDEQYISPAEFPYAFRRVDASWLAGEDSARPVDRAGS